MENNSNEPLVSIIMNCYNGEAFLRQAIDSIYSQTYQHWEIIFWDNASSDRSGEIAQSYDSKLKYYCAKETSSLGKARNIALGKATGKYVAFLDTDDLYLPEKLSKQVTLMDKDDYPLCYGSAIIINENNKEISKKKVVNKSGHVFKNLLVHYEINMQSVMLRRSYLYENKINFDCSFEYCPDYNLFMTIAAKYPVAVVCDYIVKYRKLANSLSAKTVNIAPVEIELVLNSIQERIPGISEKYHKEFSQAHAKVRYYIAIAFLHKRKRWSAIREMTKIGFRRIEYLMVLFATLAPIPDKLVLKLLKR